MEQNRQCNGNGISINEDELLEFMKSSHKVFLPESNVEKRKTINRIFHDSCMVVQTPNGGYFVGELNWTNFTGYSINVNGKEMHFSYSNTKAIFKP